MYTIYNSITKFEAVHHLLIGVDRFLTEAKTSERRLGHRKHVRFKGCTIYMRWGTRVDNDHARRQTLTIATVDIAPQGIGIFSALLSELENPTLGYNMILIENVSDPRFGRFFQCHAYDTLIASDVEGVYGRSFIKILGTPQ